MSAVNAFSVAQPIYAELGIATFPVEVTSDGQKKPAVKNWQCIGLPASAKFAERFTHAEMLGFCPGSRSRVTVLDVDTDDERVLSDALMLHGKTPLVVKTASGKFHAYYRHSGERRLIRPWKDKSIDVLGGGFVVAPPSVAPNRNRYQPIEGRIEDIANLPAMRGMEDLRTANRAVVPRTVKGERNKTLFTYCLRAASKAGNQEELHAMALAENATYLPPLDEARVAMTVKSAWKYQVEGKNWVGGSGTVGLSFDEVDTLYDPAIIYDALLAVRERHLNGAGAKQRERSKPAGSQRVRYSRWLLHCTVGPIACGHKRTSRSVL